MTAPQPNRRPAQAKVVHVVVAGDIGGAERFLVGLASRPEQSGADHSIALMTPNPMLRELFSGAGLKMHDRGPVRENPLAYLWRSLGPADVSWLADALVAERADVVHVHTFGSHVIGVRAALKLGLPVIRTEHGIRHYLDVSCLPFRRWTLERTDKVVAVSQFVANFVRQSAPYARDKVQVIRNAVDTGRFRPGGPPPEGPFTFVVVCRLEPLKRVDVAIEALSKVPDARLLIVGDGSARASLEALARKLRVDDRVCFAGYQSDPRAFVAKAHVAVSSCDIEALGLSVLEAQAMERPAIAFATSGVSEIIKDGQTGWLVPDFSANDLARCMIEAASDRARCAAFGADARRFVEDECGIEAMCGAYAQTYTELINRSSPAHGRSVI